MNWQVLSNISKITDCCSITADLKLPSGVRRNGIFFLADSADTPSQGFLFAITSDGFYELFSFTDDSGEPVSLARRKSAILQPDIWFRIKIILKNGICTIFTEDSRSEDDGHKSDSQPEGGRPDINPPGFLPWPMLELPLDMPPNGITAIAAESDDNAPLSDPDALFRNLHIIPIDSSPSNSYKNPVLYGYADPDILYYRGTYYLYATSSTLSAGYEAYRSKDLVNWDYGGIVMGEAWGLKEWYWAPDIMERNGKFYMLVSVREHLGIAVADSPLGPFIPQPDYLFEKSIDGHFFVDDDGTVYIYYVSWRAGKTYAIYGMQMEADCVTPVLSTETLVIKASEEWEKQKAAVAEAPYILKHKGIYYLTYSGSHFESVGYAVGYAMSDNPLGPFVKYSGNPILSYHYKVHGPGHHCIVKSPDGRERFIVYHTHHNLEKVSPRNICIDRIRFVPEKNKPDRLEVYGPSVIPMPYPSGCR